ncbi:MAG: FAD-binding protein [Candidatus Lokiarchaeota archaeon]|nr:FAD-binding protein [Candidatus Lokiarchaeota archaeon]
MGQQFYNKLEWPYPVKWHLKNEISTDVLVLGGGIAGSWAAVAVAKKGVKVALVEKGATIRSGAGGSGCDHWESAATNPCSHITPEELTLAMIKDHDGYNNGISHYIECKEGYDRLLDLEKMGGKIRDTEDEFKGAKFRDEKTKFLFAYDYENKFTLRVWGTTFKPALYKECKRLGVDIYDRIMATSLLTEAGKQGTRIVGATGVNGRTGQFIVFKAKATILCMSRPTRVWLFSPGLPGISEFRPPQCMGDGHAMGWKAGVEFTLMERSIRGQWSGERSYPPYGTGNTHNTWYACSLVDANGKEIPWIDRDGNILKSIFQRYRPASGQKFFLKGGGESDFHLYEYQGPDILPVEILLKKGFKLPFYADLPSMPKYERKAIWGLMVGQEGKSKIPILQTYTKAGFDPEKHLLQSYGEGWTSASFLPRERQLFGVPGGILNDWDLKTNLVGLYAAGDQLFASDCVGHAAATGYYAGRHAADYAMRSSEPRVDFQQVKSEKNRIYSIINQSDDGIGWKEFNMYITRIMQNYCGEIKSDELLKLGLKLLEDMERDEALKLYARNPHELIRSLEVLNILTNAKMIIHSCLARKASSKHLHFIQSDYPEMDPPEWHKFITVKLENNKVKIGELPIDYYGSLTENYATHNEEYIKGGIN